MSTQRSDSGRTALVVIGAVLVLFGLYALAQQSGLVNAWIPDWVRLDWSELRTGLTLILLGGFVIWLARGGLRAPRAGTRLYRSAEDKWVAGVLGGLANYFGVDSTLLRLVFIVLVLLGAGWPIGGYILMAILVPKEPAGGAVVTAVPTPPTAPPPAPPAAPPVVAPAPAPPAPEVPPVPAEATPPEGGESPDENG